MNNNKHIEEYLDYYLNLSISPEYAVMINEDWGTEKVGSQKIILKKRN